MKHKSVFQNEVTHIINEATKNSRIKLDIISYDLSENIETEETSIKNCLVRIQNLPGNENEEIDIIFNSDGKGFVDALYKGLTKEFDLFSTLADFSFHSFKISAETKKNTSSEDKATAQLVIQNKTTKEEFVFHSNKVFSINMSAVEVVIQALEFFINAEQAVKLIHRAHKDALKRYRNDLVERYTSHMITLTKITSYFNVVKKEK